MGVRKYRSVEEMPGPSPLPPLRPENLRLALELMDLARRLCPVHYPPGVHRYRSHEELLRERERRDSESARTARARIARND